jgi:glycosyltransferase involved in cell wall biosynthesis
MRSGLPIVAYGAGAVPETLGDAGMLLESKRPSVVATVLDRIRRDRSLADQLTAAGHRRLASFAPASTRARFVDVLGALDAPVEVSG